MAFLEFRNLRKDYGKFSLDLSFSVEEGELLCILGPSGSGKSTLFNLLSGIEAPDNGQILLDGEDITKKDLSERGIGMVFQDFSLFTSMNTEKNIQYGMKKKDKGERHQFTKELLEMVGLSGYEKRKVDSLSGGEAQRVALARAVAAEPRILLLDEPLSALDAPLRKKLRGTIRSVHDTLGMTMLHVTHDREEAFAIADRILILKDGKLLEMGRPEEIYRNPKSLTAAFFTGDGTALPAAFVYGPDTEGSIFFRPESISISEEPLNERMYPNHLVFNNVQVETAEYTGSGYLMGLSFKGYPILAYATLKPRQKVVSLLILRDMTLYF